MLGWFKSPFWCLNAYFWWSTVHVLHKSICFPKCLSLLHHDFAVLVFSVSLTGSARRAARKVTGRFKAKLMYLCCISHPSTWCTCTWFIWRVSFWLLVFPPTSHNWHFKASATPWPVSLKFCRVAAAAMSIWPAEWHNGDSANPLLHFDP